ncbi:MAG: CDP-alcohol phosphatidyltransferase family protein [Candidatus Altimarinota bacterium]
MENWLIRYALYFLVGAVFSLSLMRVATPNLLFWLSRLPYCSPNWMSLWRIPLVWLGFMLYLSGNHFVGLMIVVFALTLDRLDGKMATAIKNQLRPLPHREVQPSSPEKPYLQLVKPIQLEEGELFQGKLVAWHLFDRQDRRAQPSRDRQIFLDEWVFPHIQGQTWLPMFRLSKDQQLNPPARRLSYTGLGEWLDPLVDKLNFLPLYVYLASRQELAWWAVLPMLVVDLISTIIRKPFTELPILGWLKSWVRQTEAGPFGKTKYVFQFVTLLALMPSLAGWLPSSSHPESRLIASTFLLIAVFAGSIGVLSRFTLFSLLLHKLALAKAYGRFRSLYRHEETPDGTSIPVSKQSDQGTPSPIPPPPSLGNNLSYLRTFKSFSLLPDYHPKKWSSGSSQSPN